MTSLPLRIYEVKFPPGRVVNQDSFPANIAGRCRLAPSFVSTRGNITTMAAHKDDAVDFDWVANKEELEEVLCVLAGSDPENCSYSRVSVAGRIPAGSFCSRKLFYKYKATNVSITNDSSGADLCAVCVYASYM